MKKNYLMFLLFCALGVFVSCSDSDNSDPEPEPEPKPEAPVYVVVSEFAVEGKEQSVFGQTFTPVNKSSFTYDADGKLVSRKISGVNSSGTAMIPYDWTFAYGTNQVTVTAPDDERNEKRNKTTMTLENERVKTMVIEDFRSSAKETCTATYTADGYLEKFTGSTLYENDPEPFLYTEEFEYTGGNLMKYTYTKGNKKKFVYTFNYGSGTYKNNGTIDLFSTIGIFETSSAPLMSGVGGKRSEKLPVSVNLVTIYLEDGEEEDNGNVTFSYKEVDGLVVSYTKSDDTENTYKITYKK